MRFFTVAAALAAPLLVSAIEFTSPSLNSTVTKGSKFELSWDTVDTDPSAFSVYLVNFVNWPPSYTLLAQDIETSAGAVSVQVPCSVDSSAGYQFNAINGTNVYVIYAQTPKFSIGGSDCTDPTPSPGRSLHLRAAGHRHCHGYNHPVTLTKPPARSPGPVVTKAPHGSVVEEDDEEENVTSTIYRTTYLPLEMAPTACTC